MRICASRWIHMGNNTHSQMLCNVPWLHVFVWHDEFACVTSLIHMFGVTNSCVTWCRRSVPERLPISCTSARWLNCWCGMTHSYMRHSPFICVAWLVCMCAMTQLYVWQDLFMCVTCDMTHSCVSRDSGGRCWSGQRQSHPHMCDTTDSYVWHDSFIRATRLIYVWSMTHSCVCHDSFICATWLIRMFDVTQTAGAEVGNANLKIVELMNTKNDLVITYWIRVCYMFISCIYKNVCTYICTYI